MIWFDNLRSYGTPNYYVQKLFSVNRGTRLLPVLLDGSNKNGQSEVYATASLDEPAGEVILKVVNTGPAAKPITINIAGPKQLSKTGKTYVLGSSDLKAENSLDNPTRVAPVERQITVSGNQFPFTLTPQSLTVIRLALR